MKKNSLCIILFQLLLLTNLFSQNTYSLEVQAKELIYSDSLQFLFAISGPEDDQYPNSLVKIDSDQKIIKESLSLEAEPACMDITYSQNYVYIAYEDISTISKVNLNTFEIDYNIDLGNNGSIDYFAEDIVSIPSHDDIIVVSRKFRNISPRHAGIVAYKGQTKLVNEVASSPPKNIIVAAKDTNLIFALNTELSSHEFSRLSIDTINGLSLIDIPIKIELTQSNRKMKIFDSLIYIDDGQVLNPYFDEPHNIGRYTGFPSHARMSINKKHNKTYFISQEFGSTYFCHFNHNTFDFYGKELIDFLSPAPNSATLIKAATTYNNNGVAFIIDGNGGELRSQIVFYEECNILPSTNLQINQRFNYEEYFNSKNFYNSIEIQNSGQMTAIDVVVIDTINDTLNIDGILPTAGNISIENNIITWCIDSLNPKGEETLKIYLSTCDTISYVNRVSIESNTMECNILDNINKSMISMIPQQDCFHFNHLRINSGDIPFKVYPNPFSEFVQIQGHNIESVELFDLYGGLIEKTELMSKKNYIKLDIQETTPPFCYYILKIKTASDIYIVKLIKI